MGRTEVTTTTDSGRSLIRRIGKAEDKRTRLYLLRAALLLCVVSFVVGLGVSTSWQLLNPNGLGRLMYILHDSVYLWLRGHLWTAWFPYVFVWLVPLLVAVFVALVEWLSPIGVLRPLHRNLILWLVDYRWGRRLLAPKLIGQNFDVNRWHASIQDGDTPEVRSGGFARRVVRAAQDSLWHRAALAHVDNKHADSDTITRLIRLSELRLRLDPSDAQAYLRALEIVSLWPKYGASLVADIRSYIDEVASDCLRPPAVLIDCVVSLSTVDLVGAQTEALRQLAYLQRAIGQSSSHGPVEFACRALAIFALGVALGMRLPLPQARTFHRLWVRGRLNELSPEVAADLARAESLISFEIWAKLSAVLPQWFEDGSLLTEDLPNPIDVSASTEEFAWTGRVS